MGKKASEISVLVIGGGVIGLTTALVLRLHGFKVKIDSKHNLFESKKPGFINQYSDKFSDHPADLASIHAAASIIPHSVDHPSEKEILEVSQNFFHRLAFSAGFGVRVQRHYELYESPEKSPEYARVVKGFTRLDDNGEGWTKDRCVPRRKKSKGVWGWHFNAFFAEVPTYMDALYKLYAHCKGELELLEIKNLDEIKKSPYDVIVNCSGRWTNNLFNDDITNIIRGHIIKVGVNEVPRDERDQYFSYNYVPDLEVYSRSQNDKGEKGKFRADVYFYPRSDGWLLGGSRQVGNPNLDKHPNQWKDEDEQIQMDADGKKLAFKKDNWEVEVPRPIWELNRELLLDITGIDIDRKGKDGEDKYRSFAYIGYRFARSPIRIEVGNEITNKLLIHNYGHGGAGYTLSWGSAYEVLKYIEKKFEPDIEIKPQTGMASTFVESMERILTDLVVEEYVKRGDFTPLKESHI